MLALTGRSSDQRAYELADALLAADAPGRAVADLAAGTGRALAGLVYAIASGSATR